MDERDDKKIETNEMLLPGRVRVAGEPVANDEHEKNARGALTKGEAIGDAAVVHDKPHHDGCGDGEFERTNPVVVGLNETPVDGGTYKFEGF